jgi:hypothetical protein
VPRLAPVFVAMFQGVAPSPASVPSAASPHEVTIVSTVRSALGDEPVLALAFLDDARLAVLTEASVSVHRVDRSRIRPVARRDLPLPRAAVRTPGGLVLPGDDAFWALTSGMTSAVLYALAGNRLEERARADALPWPETSGGLRYREGTNLLDTPRGLFLTPRVEGLAVDAAGRLLPLSSTFEPAPASLGSPQVGGSLAALGEGRVAVSSAAPPGAPDRIEVFDRRGDTLRRQGVVPVAGSIRALAARRGPAGPRVAAAVETSTGENVVLLLALRLASP